MTPKATTITEESQKTVRPRPSEESPSLDASATTMPTKKRRKLNDGSAAKSEEVARTGFFASLGHFLSGTWFWPSSMPGDDATTEPPKTVPAATTPGVAAAPAETETEATGEKEPTKPSALEEEQPTEEAESSTAKPTTPSDDNSATDGKDESSSLNQVTSEEEEPEDSATATNSSCGSDNEDGEEESSEHESPRDPRKRSRGTIQSASKPVLIPVTTKQKGGGSKKRQRGRDRGTTLSPKMSN
mmetsp:Transcript_9291/g.19489  ORF Transcript_9291/g.19489 Transcript_9291/m.19489 type:complete len:244 (+) Transcript_9291:117-848(+)|eukprot:CAMPEP_0201123056 /NCGR_PEP_ID=MMETSP0850-20130426/6532_1 /ASSEMBLY_ACC=CAM_ASM_000622 /TAXON_ID=183588 /ORGANISM="Pseudo-nitzschia fraudulenta, Strain WWA7" /LENGTH=243 /DNA_ID=CAMNT_0047389869 /DNA_START=84 /DNA_END=815 /DNA_ORIENTATION=-